MSSNPRIKKLKEILEKVRGENNGVLSPEVLVKYAEPKDSPLHKYFLWNNSEAAEKYRLQQAHDILRSVKVTILLPKEETPVNIRCYVSLPSDRNSESGNYRHIVDVAASRPMKTEYILSVLKELEAFKLKLAITSKALQDDFKKFLEKLSREI